MANKYERWRPDAEKLLQEPVARKRSSETVIGKVDELFGPIHDARSRGMTWRAIRDALSADKGVKVSAIESAFKRLCEERGVTAPSRRRTVLHSRKDANGATPAVPIVSRQMDENAGDHVAAPPRYSDEGLD